mgnify:FL=1
MKRADEPNSKGLAVVTMSVGPLVVPASTFIHLSVTTHQEANHNQI